MRVIQLLLPIAILASLPICWAQEQADEQSRFAEPEPPDVPFCRRGF